MTKTEKYKQIQNWRAMNPDKCKAYCKKYFEKNKEKIRRRRNETNLKIKIEVFKKYGGCCAVCGCDNINVLSMDHINNDGAERRRNGEAVGNNLYRQLLDRDKRTDLQILCANCQWIKHVWIGLPPNKIELNEFLAKVLRGDNPLYWKHYNLKIKQELMTRYGGSCKACNCGNLLVLTIDHINSNGSKDRQNKRGQNFYRHLLKLVNTRNDLQILCLNCQMEKERR